jgi:hypothetical protein
LREHPPKNVPGGTNLLKFEEMNQISQGTVVAAVRHCPLVRRIGALAEHAPRVIFGWSGFVKRGLVMTGLFIGGWRHIFMPLTQV